MDLSTFLISVLQGIYKMNLNSRYKQATNEALWAFGLTILYMVGWCVFAYGLPNTKGFFDFPLWFEFSCFYLPILFTAIIYICIKFVFCDIDLEDNENEL